MDTLNRSRPRRRWQPMRRIALILTSLGVTSEMVAILGMVLGILAGFSFMFTGESGNPMILWLAGMLCCLIRIACIQLDSLLYHHHHSKPAAEEIFVTELPERVSDAVTIIGFGFAANSNSWLGLATALAAIFSAYVRSLGVIKGAGKKSASSGPMTRVHRLILVSITSALMITSIPKDHFSTPIPQIALWVMLFGCLATIAIRWLNIQEYSDS
ncbi:MAG: hypothetical protein P1U68_06145 [Verrucomicrobiales bacterium]|nr:hypothetical protein [Verrucomicrobiales bacterium]